MNVLPRVYRASLDFDMSMGNIGRDPMERAPEYGDMMNRFGLGPM